VPPDPNNYLFQHEYGHYLQSQKMGCAYLSRVAIPSLMSDKDTHKFNPVEQDANARAFNYFNKNVPGFYKSYNDRYQDHGWDFWSNPLDPNKTGNQGNYFDYNNPNDMALVNSLKIRPLWYDYASWFSPNISSVLLVGMINGFIYR
jgi:hypothetical protein